MSAPLAQLSVPSAAPAIRESTQVGRIVWRVHAEKAATTTFVGRRSELADLSRLLRAARIVTVIGAGGVGKTRLADVVFQRTRDAVWVDLADLREGAAVPAAIEGALGLRGDGTLATTTLTSGRRDGPRLVVLDNCEHLIDSCRDCVVRLLRALPATRILATSRAALDVSGETVWRVPPLTLPNPSVSQRPGQGMRTDAVRLFVERARTAHPGLRLDEATFEVIGQICRRLDGLPLAIELVAARLRHLSLEEIAARLGSVRAFDVVKTGPAVPRHRTMNAALDWSYALLDNEQRTLLRRLSVFAAGFTATGAEAVAGEDISSAVDALAGLVDQSLVEFSPQEGRYRLLEPIRRYAEENLRAAREEQATIERAARYLIRLTTEELGLDRGVPRADLLIRADFANVAAMMPWLLRWDPRFALRMMTRFAVRYRSAVPVHLSVVASWLERGLSTYPVRDSVRADALYAWGFMLWSLDREGASADLQRRAAKESLAIASDVGDERGVAQARSFLAVLAASYGSTEEGLAAYDALIPTLAHPRMLAMAHSRRAVLRQLLHDHDGARSDLRAAHAHWDRSADALASGRGITMICAAEVMFGAGRLDEAIAQARMAIAAQRANAEPLEAAAFVGLAHLAAAVGDDERALRLVGIADSLRGEVGSWLEPRFRLTDWSWLPLVVERLGPRAVRLRVEGRRLPLSRAVAYALGEHDGAPLTARETVAATLVADGLTDKEIAARLRISDRTAENHVQHVRDKLGLRSRVEIARWIGAQTHRTYPEDHGDLSR